MGNIKCPQKAVRLSESKLRKIISESIANVLKEMDEYDKRDYIEQIVQRARGAFKDKEKNYFVEPYRMASGKIAIAFCQDDGNEDIDILYGNERGKINGDWDFISSIDVNDAYAIAVKIGNWEIK